MALIGSISGSVGAGSALTSTNAITGTLVVANVSANFPPKPPDAVFFVSGSTTDSNTKSLFGGDLRASGSITALVNLRSEYSSGDEGGEIFLSKPVTSTTINNGVTIDVWQNRVRFFEQGGTARGYYFDITKAGGSVITNLAPNYYYVTGAYTASYDDKILGVDTSTTAITITLPSGSVVTPGYTFVVKDETGNANNKNITIAVQGTDSIDLGTFTTINSPLGSKSIYYSNNPGKFFIW
jgi:hypothetical protein